MPLLLRVAMASSRALVITDISQLAKHGERKPRWQEEEE
jgi:hypothetical protein